MRRTCRFENKSRSQGRLIPLHLFACRTRITVIGRSGSHKLRPTYRGGAWSNRSSSLTGCIRIMFALVLLGKVAKQMQRPRVHSSTCLLRNTFHGIQSCIPYSVTVLSVLFRRVEALKCNPMPASLQVSAMQYGGAYSQVSTRSVAALL